MVCVEPRVLTYLRELIACQSVNPPGLEKCAAEYVAEKARALGASISLPEVSPGRPNVVAQWKFGNGRKHLLLHAHLDVVPPSGKWANDPFAMSVKDGKAFGRGSCDTKGSLAAMLTAVEILLRNDRDELSGTLTVLGVVGEETGGIGTQHFLRTAEMDPAASVVVIGEPTKLDVVIAHKGISRRKVTFAGKAGHASEPEKAQNAIYMAAHVVRAIEELNHRLAQKRHPLGLLPCVSATVIHGGVKDNVIPDGCELSMDRRRIPGEDDQQFDRELQDIMAEVSRQGHALEGRIEVLGCDKEPASIDVDHPFVQLALREANRALKETRRPKVAAFGTDMPFVRAAGMPAVVLGPGGIEQAHTVDEFVEIRQVVTAAEAYAGIARETLR